MSKRMPYLPDEIQKHILSFLQECTDCRKMSVSNYCRQCFKNKCEECCDRYCYKCNLGPLCCSIQYGESNVEACVHCYVDDYSVPTIDKWLYG